MFLNRKLVKNHGIIRNAKKRKHYMIVNKQIPMKQDRSGETTSVLVHSIFPTIQGEGVFAGTPCVFLRLGGCNLQCPSCDTEYTQGSAYRKVKDIVDELEAKMPKNASLVVITGGEPFRQQIGALIARILSCSPTIKVQIETNGTLFDETTYYDHPRLFIMCSPKTGKVNDKLKPYITAYKYVGGANELVECSYLSGRQQLEDHGLMPDGLPARALGHTAKPYLARPHEGFTGKVFLQPIDRQNDELNLAHQMAVVKSCLDNGYTLCLQIHKIICVE